MVTMSFFDSVKEDVREEHQPDDARDEDAGKEGEDDVPFDQLKKGAEEQDDDTEQNTADASDDDIEVLRSDDSSGASSTGNTGQSSPPPSADTRDAEPEQEPAPEAGQTEAAEPGTADSSDAVARDEVVQALKRIEEQNDAMLDVLRGIKRSIDS